MTWMNEWDVEDALQHYGNLADTHPNALRAADALYNLMDWTNANSDGWPFWNKPSNASQRLQTWLSLWRNRYMQDDRRDLTNAQLSEMLRPIKAFLTRQGVDWREVL